LSSLSQSYWSSTFSKFLTSLCYYMKRVLYYDLVSMDKHGTLGSLDERSSGAGFGHEPKVNTLSFG